MSVDQAGEARDVYARIGVRPFINCCGTRTIHGGSLMLPEVKRVMDEASDRFVNMDELMEAVGHRLAELTGAEWGIVTSGAAAALCLATAACVAGTDPEKMLRLPNTAGFPHRVAMLGAGRFTYDHAVRMVGAKVVEIGTLEALAGVLDDSVVMVCLLGAREAEGTVRLEDIAALARPRGIPIVVDAASEHLERPVPYLVRGATMVAYSGGKYLRGPQCSGLLLGEKAWVRTAWVNAAPHHAYGRALKVGKEEILGLLAAVEHWARGRDHDSERQQWESDLAAIREALRSVPGVTAEVRQLTRPTERVPRLEIRWERGEIGLTGLELREELQRTEPRIMLDDRGATESSVFILPFALQAGEAKIVGERIRDVLADLPSKAAASGVTEPPIGVAGEWDLTIEYVRGHADHRVRFEQHEGEIAGEHRTHLLKNPLQGQVVGGTIRFSSAHPFEGTSIVYSFTGSVDGASMEGTVQVGSSGESAPGLLNSREYGTGRWHGRRRG